jgi:putative N6-adenine-specific DNA methylase
MPEPTFECYAVAPPGVEAITARELAGLGLAPGEQEPGGVAFRAPAAGLYAANLELRTASRVLVRAGSFHASTFYELERRAKQIPWARFVAPGGGVAFRVTSRKSKLYHQRAVAERLVASVAHAVAGGHAVVAADDEMPADRAQLFVVRLVHDQCTVSADSSGLHLHQRGYRLATAKAPLRETLAAAMLLGAGWDGSAPLLDPMCGSGTIVIEAALLARRIAPGLARTFGFERWPAFDAGCWARVTAAARERALPAAPGPIQGSDRDAGAVRAAAANAERAGVAGSLELRQAAISAIAPPPGPGWVVTNPPYGVRIGERAQLRDLFAQFGKVLRRRCPGWQVALLSARREFERQTGIGLAPVFETTNGGIRVRLVQGRVE